MPVKIAQITDTSFTVNGKTLYEDINGNITGRVNLTSTELDQFNKYYTSLKSNKNDSLKSLSTTGKLIKVVWLYHCGHSTQTKNNLQKAVYSCLKTINRKVIFNDQLDLSKRQIIFAIRKLNQTYSRCTPLNVTWHDINGDLILSGVGFISFMLKKGMVEVDI